MRTDEKKKRKGSKSKGKMEKGEKKMGRDERGRQSEARLAPPPGGFEQGLGRFILRCRQEELENFIRPPRNMIQMSHSFGEMVGEFSVDIEFPFEHHGANSAIVDFVLKLVGAIFLSVAIGLQELLRFVDRSLVLRGTFFMGGRFDVEVVVSQPGNVFLLLRGQG